MYEQLDKPGNIANLWVHLGDTYRQWGKHAEALRCYDEAKGRYEQLGRTDSVANVLLGKGFTYRDWSKYAEISTAMAAASRAATPSVRRSYSSSWRSSRARSATSATSSRSPGRSTR